MLSYFFMLVKSTAGLLHHVHILLEANVFGVALMLYPRYALYDTTLTIVKCYYRPYLEGGELEARRKLTYCLSALAVRSHENCG